MKQRFLLMFCLPLFAFVLSGIGQNLYSQTISTFAGTGTMGYTGDGGPATAADISGVAGVACDVSGNVYVVDQFNSLVRKVDASGTITTFAGIGSAGYSGDGGPATNAELNFPVSVATDLSGNVYIVDVDNSVIRMVNTSGIISTFAGTVGSTAFSGDGGPATNAEFFFPYAVACDIAGNVYVADAFNYRVRKINTSGIISTFAGDGSAGYSGDGGAATAASIDSVFSVACDASGNVYFGATNYTVRKVAASGIVSTVAGTGSFGYSGDGGPATAAQIGYAFGLTCDISGNLYISDMMSHYVRMISASGTINQFAGTGTPGYSGDGGPATSAQLDMPWGLAYGTGGIYIGDQNNSRVRVVGSCVTVAGPITGPSTVCRGATITLTDTSTGGAWSSSNPSVASINATGVVRGNAGGSVTITYTVTGSCGTAIATKNISVNPFAGAITGIDSVCPGSSITLTNAVAGGTWSSSNNTIASVSTAGVVLGRAAGFDTIRYIVTSSCGNDTAKFRVKVRTNAACHTGVDDVSGMAAALQLFPNPNNGSFTLAINSDNNEEATITITNMMGEKVREMVVPATSGSQLRKTELHLNVPPGIYFLTSATTSSRMAIRFVVE